jgi:hypothetical protein
MGSSLVLSCARVQDGVIRRSELMIGAEFGVGDGTVMRRGMSGWVWRDIVLDDVGCDGDQAE